MKHLAKTIIAICLFLFSGNVFGQDFLGKTYKEIIAFCKTENLKAEETVNEDGFLLVYAPVYSNGGLSEIRSWIFTDSKTKKESRICDIEQIQFLSIVHRKIIFDDYLKYLDRKGYKKTNYKSGDSKVYKSNNNENHSLEHYLCFHYAETEDGEEKDAYIMYYLTTDYFEMSNE